MGRREYERGMGFVSRSCENNTARQERQPSLCAKEFTPALLRLFHPPYDHHTRALTTRRQTSATLVELLKLALLLGLVLNDIEVLDEVRDVIIVLICSGVWRSLLVLLDGLVGLGELAQ